MPENEAPKDPLIGVFDIYFKTSRNVVSPSVRIITWKWNTSGEVFYLIGDDGSIYNFHNIAKMIRIGD